MAISVGYVVWRALHLGEDMRDDGDRLPNLRPITSGTVRFTPLVSRSVDETTTPAATVAHGGYLGVLNDEGVLVDPDGFPSLALPVGPYEVTFAVADALVEGFRIEVTAEHTTDNPIELALIQPVPLSPATKFVVNEQVYLDTLAARDETIAALPTLEQSILDAVTSTAADRAAAEVAAGNAADAVAEAAAAVLDAQAARDVAETYAATAGTKADTATAAILGDDATQSAQVIEDRIAAGVAKASGDYVLVVEQFAQSGDRSDLESWQRATDRACELVAFAPSIQIVSRKVRHVWHGPLNYRGVKNVRYGGVGPRIVIEPLAVDGNTNGIQGFQTVTNRTNNLPQVVPTRTFYAAGDSFIDGRGYLATLGTRSNGGTVVDGGSAGIDSTTLAVRLGALPLSATFTNNQIGTGAETVLTATVPAEYWRAGMGIQYAIKVVAKTPSGDIPGRLLLKTTTTPTLRFAPTTPPTTPISAPAGTVLQVVADTTTKTGIGYENASLMVWIGRNDSTFLAEYQRNIAAIRDKFTGPQMYLTILNSTNEKKGSAGYANVNAFNKALYAAVGAARVFDARRYIINELLWSMGLQATQADLDAIALDSPPPSIMATDGVHLTDDAYTALGHEIYRQAVERGLFPEQPGDITRGVSFENLEFRGGAAYVPDGVHDRYQDRTFTANRFQSFITATGHHTPTQSGMGVVEDITILNCRMIGSYGLPILLQGVSNVTMERCHVKRCLDVGFTFTRGLTVRGNAIYWSADNGLSLSRGCTDVVCEGNRIVGSYYSGIHFGGFGNDRGPQRISIHGNTILNSRMYGISALDAPRDASVVGNVIDGVRRGTTSTANRDAVADIAPLNYGTGIHIQGMYESSGAGSTPEIKYWARGISVIGNTVRNCDRSGIIFGAGTDGATASGNTVIDVGSDYNAAESVQISSTHTYYNIGIGSYGLQDSAIRNLNVAGNTIIDTRAVPLINYGVRVPSTGGSQQRSNLGANLRNALTY